MSEHKLQQGRMLIDGLLALGGGLGYYVRPESPVRKSRRNPPAVDVAWMADEDQEFPLMIFEVETSAGNTIANNPTKIFGQRTEQFEKPLFFFHAILRAGAETSRIDSLRTLFGLNNYRVYRLDHNEKTDLILDVLSQHRRLKKELDILVLRALLTHEAWSGIDAQVVMRHVENLHFRSSYLHSYASLARVEPAFVPTFVQRLAFQADQKSRTEDGHGYQTYIGQHVSGLIHLAILSRALPKRRASLFEDLQSWQERMFLMPQIAPNFGLERDYDDFLFCIASGLAAAAAGIFGNHLEARVYLAEVIRVLLEGMNRTRPCFSFYTATWLLHLSVLLPDSAPFNFARTFINTKGGIRTHSVLNPPFQLPPNNDYPPEQFPWQDEIFKEPAPVPELPHFREQLQTLHPPDGNNDNAILLGVDLLTEQGDLNRFAPKVLRLLSCPL